MKNQTLVPGICIVLLVAALFAAGCTLTSGRKVTPTPVPTPIPTPVSTTPPAETPGQSACGFTTCHGLDLACGMDAPQMCTMEYRIGDKCRQYARCDASGGGCKLVIEPKFTACKACVEQCQIAAGADSLAAFSCEEKC
jgi:hypothetical protein